jgi:hypothetical protein
LSYVLISLLGVFVDTKGIGQEKLINNNTETSQSQNIKDITDTKVF